MSRIAPLKCETCGANVPLADGEATACRYCHSVVPIPATYQELRRDGEKAREARRAVESMLRTCLGRSVPPWAPQLYKWTVIPAAVLGVPLALGLTQGEYRWFVREWAVFGMMVPFLASLLPWLVLWAYTKPGLYMAALGVSLRPAPRRPDAEGFDCGECGAPLSVEPDALAATCDYCRADSWVSKTASGYDAKEEATRDAKNLAALVKSREFQSFDVRLLLTIYPVVMVLGCVGMWFLLPGRSLLPGNPCSERVGPTWCVVGDADGVVDLAATKKHLIAVRDNGDVLVTRDHDWKAVAEDYRGVAANTERALLVGAEGRVAWLRDKELSPIEAPTEADLNDAWLGSDGSAVVVGAKGLVLMLPAGGSEWQHHDLGTGNPMVAVFARNLTDVYAVGGITINHYDGQRWQATMLEGLPGLKDVVGSEDEMAVVAADLDDPSKAGRVFTNHRSKPSIWTPARDHKKRGYAAVALGDLENGVKGDELWIVGSEGLVYSVNRPKRDKPAPCEGPLSAVLVRSRRLFVAGRDGVFLLSPRVKSQSSL